MQKTCPTTYVCPYLYLFAFRCTFCNCASTRLESKKMQKCPIDRPLCDPCQSVHCTYKYAKIIRLRDVLNAHSMQQMYLRALTYTRSRFVARVMDCQGDTEPTKYSGQIECFFVFLLLSDCLEFSGITNTLNIVNSGCC